MNPTLAYADEAALAAPPGLSFAVRNSREMPSCYELALADDHGSQAHWVVPMLAGLHRSGHDAVGIGPAPLLPCAPNSPRACSGLI